MKKITILTAILIAFVVFTFQIKGQEAKRNNDAAIVRNLNSFGELFRELNMNYVDTINVQKSIDTAIGAMLNDIDPYTEYIPASEREQFMTIATGEYGGIGSYIMEKKDGVYISQPYENSPAALGGLKAGDKIIKIDNDSVVGWKSAAVSAKLKGTANTPVSLIVQRPYVADSILTFNLNRKKILVNSVSYSAPIEGGIGYIKLETFNSNSGDEVKNALIQLKKDPNVKSIVLDLRGNGGGILESAIKIVGLFVPKNTEVLITRGRTKQSEKIYKTSQEPIDKDIPLAVLIDGGSASASEVVAGSLQDLDRAIIIGNRSFGKGLVQTTRPLSFDALLKVTTAKYYIPSGRLIQAIDYSNRNADGSVDVIPDSLTKAYKTANGREVRDGRGITPDITIEYPNLTRLNYNIIRDNWAFDFATKYVAENPKAPNPQTFEITDSIYEDFKKFIDPKRFNYDKVCEVKLGDLKKTAEIEGYMNDETKAQFDALEKLLKHDLAHDLDIHRKEISEFLSTEILTRYFYQKGEVISNLKSDIIFPKTIEIMSSNEEIQKILNPQVVAKKK